MSDEEKKLSRRTFIKGAAVGTAAVAGSGLLSACGQEATPTPVPEPTAEPVPEGPVWDYEADVVVIGAGAAGFPAALRARELGASVILVEANYDIGGRAMTSGGTTPIGGGTRAQIEAGIEDSPEILFKDMTDWSVLTTSGLADYRYNDPALMKAAVDLQPGLFDWCEKHGMTFIKSEDYPSAKGSGWGISALRNNQPHDDLCEVDPVYSPALKKGAAYVRPLEKSCKANGIQMFLNRHADKLIREEQFSGKVVGITASYTPRIIPGTETRLEPWDPNGFTDDTKETINIKANKGVIIATSGVSGNVEFRRIYDWRLQEFIQCSNQPFEGPGRSQDGVMILDAIDHGASLWAVTQMYEHGGSLRKRSVIGCQYTYTDFKPENPTFPWSRATGLRAPGRVWGQAIAVNQVGKRFYDESGSGYTYGRTGPDVTMDAGVITDYVHGNWRNTEIKEHFKLPSYTDASLAINEGCTFPDYYIGPTWLIFDQGLVDREGWDVNPPYTDPEFFFSASTLAELAGKIKQNPYSKVDMPPANLEATVARYNELVELGEDSDFDKADLEFKIETPPFYAAWCTVVKHDSYGLLRTNHHAQVIDRWGSVIPGLYAAGEAVGGWAEHGLGKCLKEGYLAGDHVAQS